MSEELTSILAEDLPYRLDSDDVDSAAPIDVSRFSYRYLEDG